MRIVKMGTKYTKNCLHVTSTSCSGIWGGVVGFIQRMSVKCIRPSPKESC